MEYRSVADLNDTILFNGFKFPADADLVVGIPRSGLLAANLVALNLNLPLLDLESFLNGARPKVGRTVQQTMKGDSQRRKKVLIVDDSILTGLSMAHARERIEHAGLDAEFCYCAIYGTWKHHPEIDFYLERVEHPRVFQWNLMRHNRLTDACFDIDGVLCHDPSPAENDDGERYIDFLLNAMPLIRPQTRIRHLVTSRLAKYRPQTEQWLKQHGIEYDNLWMLDLASAEERRRQKAHAEHKAAIYAKTGACLFVESDDRQAVQIAQMSGLPVLSIEGQRMVWPADNAAARRRYRKQSGKSSNIRSASYWRAIAVRILHALIGKRGITRIKTMLNSRVMSLACSLALPL